MKVIFVLLLIPWASFSVAQQLVSTAGTSMSNSSLTVEYSIGEIVTTTLTGTTQVVTQGLLQPTYAITTVTNELFDAQFSLRCYPNPVVNELVVETDFKDFRKASLYSIDGKLMSQRVFDYQNIHVNELPIGSYILILADDKNLYSKTIKISKQ